LQEEFFSYCQKLKSCGKKIILAARKIKVFRPCIMKKFRDARKNFSERQSLHRRGLLRPGSTIVNTALRDFVAKPLVKALGHHRKMDESGKHKHLHCKFGPVLF